MAQGIIVNPEDLCGSSSANFSMIQHSNGGFNASDFTFKVDIQSSTQVTAEVQIVPLGVEEIIHLQQSGWGSVQSFEDKHELKTTGTFTAELSVNGQRCRVVTLVNGCQPGFRILSGACLPDTCGTMHVRQLPGKGSNESQLQIEVVGAKARPLLLLSRADADRLITQHSRYAE